MIHALDLDEWVRRAESPTCSNFREYLGDRDLTRDPALDSRSQQLPLWRRLAVDQNGTEAGTVHNGTLSFSNEP
jgi:hypothetical protein